MLPQHTWREDYPVIQCWANHAQRRWWRVWEMGLGSISQTPNTAYVWEIPNPSPKLDTNRIEKNPLFKNLVQNLHTAKMKNKRNLCLVDCKDRLNDWNFLSAFILTDQFLVYRGSLLKQISDGNNFKQTIVNIIKNSKDLAITLQHLS